MFCVLCVSCAVCFVCCVLCAVCFVCCVVCVLSATGYTRLMFIWESKLTRNYFSPKVASHVVCCVPKQNMVKGCASRNLKGAFHQAHC